MTSGMNRTKSSETAYTGRRGKSSCRYTERSRPGRHREEPASSPQQTGSDARTFVLLLSSTVDDEVVGKCGTISEAECAYRADGTPSGPTHILPFRHGRCPIPCAARSLLLLQFATQCSITLATIPFPLHSCLGRGCPLFPCRRGRRTCGRIGPGDWVAMGAIVGAQALPLPPRR